MNQNLAKTRDASGENRKSGGEKLTRRKNEKSKGVTGKKDAREKELSMNSL